MHAVKFILSEALLSYTTYIIIKVGSGLTFCQSGVRLLVCNHGEANAAFFTHLISQPVSVFSCTEHNSKKLVCCESLTSLLLRNLKKDLYTCRMSKPKMTIEYFLAYTRAIGNEGVAFAKGESLFPWQCLLHRQDCLV